MLHIPTWQVLLVAFWHLFQGLTKTSVPAFQRLLFKANFPVAQNLLTRSTTVTCFNIKHFLGVWCVISLSGMFEHSGKGHGKLQKWCNSSQQTCTVCWRLVCQRSMPSDKEKVACLTTKSTCPRQLNEPSVALCF